MALFTRDPATLDRLTILQRWEVTRRHPYYLLHWQAAGVYVDEGKPPEAAPSQALLIAALNWTSHYVDPAIDDPWPEKGPLEGLTCAFPATVRVLARRLISLPSDLREQLARILLDDVEPGPEPVGDDDRGKYWRRNRAVENLDHLLTDEMLEELKGLVAIVPWDAPRRGVKEDLVKIIGAWGKGEETEKKRRRGDKLEDYLAVWDRREGWMQGRYDAAAERRLLDIGKELGKSLSTIQTRYHSAFRHITGHEYKPDTWSILFGPLKASRWASWRKSKQRTDSVDLVPETRLGGAGVIAGEADPRGPSDLREAEWSMDIRTLIEKGHGDDQIVAELECPDDLVKYLRGRISDGL
jgi:hypothetical protein